MPDYESYIYRILALLGVTYLSFNSYQSSGDLRHLIFSLGTFAFFVYAPFIDLLVDNFLKARLSVIIFKLSVIIFQLSVIIFQLSVIKQIFNMCIQSAEPYFSFLILLLLFFQPLIFFNRIKLLLNYGRSVFL